MAGVVAVMTALVFLFRLAAPGDIGDGVSRVSISRYQARDDRFGRRYAGVKLLASDEGMLPIRCTEVERASGPRPPLTGHRLRMPT
ncbi:hypothetical protein GGR54DRAFT_622282 [Hypoxylon sp. NC1633]|nr:hypothetical protein GGR54DRAFT_622282 [Hypoxylon sp. NC1633]